MEEEEEVVVVEVDEELEQTAAAVTCTMAVISVSWRVGREATRSLAPASRPRLRPSCAARWRADSTFHDVPVAGRGGVGGVGGAAV